MRPVGVATYRARGTDRNGNTQSQDEHTNNSSTNREQADEQQASWLKVGTPKGKLRQDGSAIEASTLSVFSM